MKLYVHFAMQKIWKSYINGLAVRLCSLGIFLN